LVVTFLTKSGGFLGPIADILGLIMNGIYEFFHLFGIQNIALSIIVFTFIVKTLMLPLTIKQQKFTKLSSRMNPELQKIQAKYKGKKDEASLKKQQAETQVIYQKYGANPTSGCLPLLISLPIMFALYSVINNIPAYVNQVYQLYEAIALQVQSTSGYEAVLTTLAEGVKNNRVTDFTETKLVVDFLSKFSSENWSTFISSFSGIDKIAVNSLSDGTVVTVADTIKDIQNVNGFLGFNIANQPGLTFPAILIPILAGGLQFIQGKQLQSKSKTDNKDNPAASAMNSMNVVMPIMSIFFCITFPIGIGLYWIATSVFAIIQQYFVNKYMDRVDVDELIKKNVAKASKRNKYMESKGISMSELAKKQTRYIESTATENTKSTESVEKPDEVVEASADITQSTQSTQTTGPKSISEIANLLKNRNEKGDK
jgi:YidC/Oxa1 family membrane protein insertase